MCPKAANLELWLDIYEIYNDHEYPGLNAAERLGRCERR